MTQGQEKSALPPVVTPQPAPMPAWVRNGLHPLIIGTMVACISMSIVQLMHIIVPEWDGTLFLVAPVLAAFAGHYTGRLARARYLSGTELLRFQALELTVMFLLIRFGTYLNDSGAEILADVRSWAEDPYRFFTAESAVAFFLAFLAWRSAGEIVRDIDAIVDPTLYSGETPPMDRLSGRFLYGGVLLLFFAGLARVGLEELLVANRLPVRGLILNVLLYFLLGIVMLVQLRFVQLASVWQREAFTVPTGLSATWARYSAIFLAVALLVALVLPTGYAFNILDLLNFLFMLFVYALSFIYYLIAFVVLLIVNLLMGEPQPAPPEPPAALIPPEIDPLLMQGGEWPWWPLVRSILFWIFALGAGGYLLRSYIQDRPELVKALRSFGFLRFLADIWQRLRTWWRSTRRALAAYLPRIRAGEPRDAEGSGRRHFLRAPGRSPRAKIFYHYLTSLDRAGAEGFPRQETQTPYEYEETLAPHLPEAHVDVTRMTRMFVEARYSDHPMTEEEVKEMRAAEERIKEALRKRRAEGDTSTTSS